MTEWIYGPAMDNGQAEKEADTTIMTLNYLDEHLALLTFHYSRKASNPLEM